ncbi:MAG: hypothetical protein E6230_00065 [Paenibacillus dendritiformis]|uniref:hypothetical protein n=1 Tax=Paenibacillus dendritiformis TaxID=130049 RepID=UPI001B0425A8|nr:hypothetical protein [Paenibacillus dendritiformis]MDU5140560.1 hypothetical protein [Paenibacillus dendritiformis]GIO70868.1 hypothetical protein J27TS7_03820 [Paenibacillus dendritiformis]
MNQHSLSHSLENCIALMTEACTPGTLPWMLGGSCGLVLQGVDIEREPRDIDLYADEAEADALHRAWGAWSADEPVWSVTGRYRSLLSHYRHDRVTAELVGSFTVTTPECRYETVIVGGLWPVGPEHEIGRRIIRLMPLAHELVFNLLREREDRTEAIVRVMNREPDKHVEAMRAVWDRCRASSRFTERLCALCPQVMAGINPNRTVREAEEE